jgi:hypothetical protein
MAQAREEMPLPRKNRPKGPPTRSVTLPKQPWSVLSYICNLPLSNVLQEPQIATKSEAYRKVRNLFIFHSNWNSCCIFGIERRRQF